MINHRFNIGQTLTFPIISLTLENPALGISYLRDRMHRRIVSTRLEIEYFPAILSPYQNGPFTKITLLPKKTDLKTAQSPLLFSIDTLHQNANPFVHPRNPHLCQTEKTRSNSCAISGITEQITNQRYQLKILSCDSNPKRIILSISTMIPLSFL